MTNPNRSRFCSRRTPAWFIPMIAVLAATGTPSRHHRPSDAEAASVVRALAPGDTLPTLVGHYLSGREARVPEHSRGKLAFLALGFTYQSRVQVEAWSERFKKDFGAEDRMTFYEIPVMGGAARMARPFIDSGMKRGTPAELHEHVITVWQDAGEWKSRMGYTAPDAAYCVLIDAYGVVRWLHAGPLDQAAWTGFERALAGDR